MRMSIYLIGLSMCCPAGMADPDSTGNSRKSFLKVNDPAFLFENLKCFIVKNSDSGRVITPVFQSLQGIDKDRSCLSPAIISYNSAHVKPRWNLEVYLYALLRQPPLYNYSLSSSLL